MDDSGIGMVGIAVWAVAGLVAAVAVAGGAVYASDYGLEATVVDKRCAGGTGILGSSGTGSSSQVTVRTKIWGIDHTVRDFPDNTCNILRAGEDGNFVVYHVRSAHTVLYEREGGACIWDSEQGLC